MILYNNKYIDESLIEKACILSGKSKEELDALDDNVKACTTNIYKCICRRCPSLHMCYGIRNELYY